MKLPNLLKAAQSQQIEFDWGQLTWYASGELDNTDAMTLGVCRIKPGCENPLHSHPACHEVLHVLQGRIAHTFDNGDIEMAAGDSITVGPDFPHRAKNIGQEDAILLVSFSTPDRKMDKH